MTYNADFFRKYIDILDNPKQNLLESQAAGQAYYKKQLLNCDVSSQESVGWCDAPGSQHRRFNELLQIGVCQEDSLLDVGCGVGHLYEYIGDQVDYHGVDPNSLAIKKAQQLHPNAKFTEGTLDDITENYDWAILNGIFSFDFPENVMIETVNQAIDKTNNGVAFNFLSGQQNPDPEFTFYKPEYIKNVFEAAEIHKTPEVVDDYTVYIRK